MLDKNTRAFGIVSAASVSLLLSWNGKFLLELDGCALVVVLFLVAVSCFSFHSLSPYHRCCNK